MPPYPWHLGGRRHHNLFVKRGFSGGTKRHLNFCQTSHSFLAAKFLDKPFFEYLEKILPFSSYFHVADSEGLDGEGLQILEGEIDFKNLYETFLSRKKIEYIPEIWNGHIEAFQPFKTALFRLRNLGW